MSITRSFTLNTSLSDEALLAPFGDNVVTDESNQATYVAGTKSLIGVYPLTVQYDWEYSFDVEHNTMVSIDIDNEAAPQTRRVLDDIVGPFIQTVGGEALRKSVLYRSPSADICLEPVSVRQVPTHGSVQRIPPRSSTFDWCSNQIASIS